jgi:hypothetical protein
VADPVFRSAYDFLAPSPDANYGSVLPFAYNREGSPSWVTEGSNQRLAMPEWLRSAAQGVVGLGESTQTGQLTPEALALLTTGSVGTGALFAPRGALAAGASRPIQAWHGSPTPGIAPGELVPSARGPLGPAVYMSPNENVAQRYAGQGGHLYERTVNPDDIFHGMRIHGQTDVNPYEVWRNQQKKLVEAAEPDKKEAINALFEKTWPDDGYSMFWELSRLYGSQEKAQEALKSAGFKGYSANIDGPEIAWFGKYGVAGGPPVPGLNVAPQQQQPSQAPGFRVAKDMVY